jgi:hypothetical protein
LDTKYLIYIYFGKRIVDDDSLVDQGLHIMSGAESCRVRLWNILTLVFALHDHLEEILTGKDVRAPLERVRAQAQYALLLTSGKN